MIEECAFTFQPEDNPVVFIAQFDEKEEKYNIKEMYSYINPGCSHFDEVFEKQCEIIQNRRPDEEYEVCQLIALIYLFRSFVEKKEDRRFDKCFRMLFGR